MQAGIVSLPAISHHKKAKGTEFNNDNVGGDTGSHPQVQDLYGMPTRFAVFYTFFNYGYLCDKSIISL
jgi:hypothetical protein